MPEDERVEKQHQALYRRYRPQTPSDLLGQDHVVRALTGAVREGRLHHAFLFCGPRGTGKTSTARILAKMINCEHGPTPEPCGECSQCVAIRDGTHVDVVEIDAASHGGVDDARDLREKAPTAPMVGREKIYIIDEAQRLSREAFDALLKLFEEPPPGVRFVLATTEPHKMPATIVGRCQRFDFRRLTIDGLAEMLQKIAGSEGVQLDPGAALAMARQAEGSARDAVSLLDQASVSAGERVDEDVVRSLLGVPQGEVQRRDRRRGRGGRSPWRVRGGRPARPGGSRPSQRDRGSARALPEPAGRTGRPRPGRSARRPRPTPTRRCGRKPTSSRRESSRASSSCCSRRRPTCAGPRRRGYPRAGPRTRLRAGDRPDARGRGRAPRAAGAPRQRHRRRRRARGGRRPSGGGRARTEAATVFEEGCDEAGDGLGRRGGSRRRSGRRDPGRRGRHPAPGSACGRRRERRRRDAPPVVGRR